MPMMPVTTMSSGAGIAAPALCEPGGDGLRVRGEHFADSARRIDWVRYGVFGAELEALEAEQHFEVEELSFREELMTCLLYTSPSPRDS